MSWAETFVAAERERLDRGEQEGMHDLLLQPQRKLLERLLAAHRAEAARLATPSLTVAEVARMTGRNPETLYRRVRKGELGTQQGKKHAVRIAPAELEKLAPRAKRRAVVPSVTSVTPFRADKAAERLLRTMGKG